MRSPPLHARPRSLLFLGLSLLLATPALGQRGGMPPWGTGESRGEDLDVTYALFGPGSDVASWWGHAALGVEDERLRVARLYNYGNFSFDEQMLARYAMGRLEFWVADAPVQPYLRFYAREDRDVRVLHLDLQPGAREKMARHLAENVLPGKRDYLYDHYRDNCSTRLRDAVDVGLEGRLREHLSVPGRMTLREHTRRYTAVNPAMSLLLDLAMNDTIDQPITRWDEAFLPDELERALLEIEVTGADGAARPLVRDIDRVHQATSRAATPELPPNHVPWLLLIGLGTGALPLLAAWLWKRRGLGSARVLLGALTTLWGLVFGVIGTLLAVMWAVTDHTVVFANENLFQVNPVWLLLLWLGPSLMRGKNVRTPERLRRVGLVLGGLALLGVALKVLPAFDQNNWNILALVLPQILGYAAAWFQASELPQVAPSPATTT